MAPLSLLGNLRQNRTISYGIYLWHLMVILKLKEIPGLNPAPALFLTLAVTLILASASWHLFEKRFLQSNSAN